MKVAILGLGYVGLPLAKLAKSKGYTVKGVDISEKAVNRAINEGIDSTLDGVRSVKESDVVVVCVPTPVDSGFMPDLGPVKEACDTIKKGLVQGKLIIIESTINPGITEEVILPILEESGLKAGTDFYLAHCPERIDPGNNKWSVQNIPRVVGGVGRDSTKKAAEFYRKLLDSDVMELSSVKAAEATKIMENSFRDINIAFVNEMAKSFDQIGIDVTEVIKAASTKPFAFMPHYPGCGVGGHCIPVDPYYLIEEAKRKGFNHRFLLLAREINNSMPSYTVEKVIEGLNDVGLCLKGTRVCVLGLSYKKDIDDLRESPSFKIIDKLKKMGAKVETYDPFILEKSSCKSLNACFENDCIIIATSHTEFLKINTEKLGNIRVIVDGRNILDKEKITSKGIKYLGIGRN